VSQKSVKFHILSNDYFGTLATVLSLIKQTPENILQYIKTLENLEEDLLYLQNSYKIVKK